MGNIISAKDVSFSYRNEFEQDVEPIQVLSDVNVDIKEGEFVAILGHNGSGKSTIAKHFNSILLPEEGTILVDGIDTKDDDKVFEIRQKVGMVFQNPDNQIVATVVEEDVAFGPENMGVEPSELRQRVDQALKTVNMYDYREHAPHKLSGGQKQRVAIAGVIAMKPKCIVLDEPTAMLDPKGRRDVLKTIKELNRDEKITIVLITHYMDEAAQADRIIVMDSGKVRMNDVPKKVFSQVESLKKYGLDVPQVTELCYELQGEGIDLSSEIITEDECVDAILKLFNKD